MPPVYYHDGKFPPDERLDWSKFIPLIGRATAAVAVTTACSVPLQIPMFCLPR